MAALDLDLCAGCGSQFSEGQICRKCTTDRSILMAAVYVLKRRGWQRKFAGAVFVRTLERYAARLGDA